MRVPFNRPCLAGDEFEYMKKACINGHISGDGEFTKKCQGWLEKKYKCKKALLVTSGTAALEMAAILAEINHEDEVILPSFTFVSTVNAFVIRGAKPIFTDIREDTLNINESMIAGKISTKTKAILPVHYAGISCQMDKIMEIARKHGLMVIEDAALGMGGKYGSQYLGSIGQLGAISFHETKNMTCGEGGALLINDPKFIERAEIIREKGTDRSRFFRGIVDKYSWVDIGSSYLSSDILAAFLLAQFEDSSKIYQKRKNIYNYYFAGLSDLEKKGLLRLPIIPKGARSSYHMFYILLPSEKIRDLLMSKLKQSGINAIFHYLPLHLSAMGRKYGYKKGDFPVTESVSGRLLRLPFYNKLTKKQQDYVVANINKAMQ